MSRQYSYAQMHSAPRASARRGDSIRDLVADWKKWSPAERVLAVVVGLLVRCRSGFWCREVWSSRCCIPVQR
jgi:hypothetical protein